MFESTIYLNVRFNFERVGKNNRTLPNELFQKCQDYASMGSRNSVIRLFKIDLW